MSVLLRFYLSVHVCILLDTGADIVVLKTQPLTMLLTLDVLGKSMECGKLGWKR